MKIDKETLEKLYLDSNKNVNIVAAQLGVATTTIRNYLRKLEVSSYTGATKPLDKDKLIELYCIENKSQTEIAKELNVHRSTVSKYINKYNIKQHKIEDLRNKINLLNLNNTEILNILGLTSYDNLNNFLTKHNLRNTTKDSISKLISKGYTEEEISIELKIALEEVKYNLRHHSLFKLKPVHINKEELESEYNNHTPIRDLSNKYKVSERTINNKLQKIKKRDNTKFVFTKDELIDLWIVKDLTLDEISELKGCSRKTVMNAKDAFGLEKESNISSQERIIKEVLDSHGILYEHRTRNIIPPFELDFYFPEHNIAIEHCGLYWHSSKFNSDSHIYDKYVLCKNKGIRLITIFEDEINYKFTIVKNKILNSLGQPFGSVYARKCVVEELTSQEGIDFLNKYHIQGAGKNFLYLGLKKEKELVAVMSFSSNNPSKSVKGIELNRYATKYSVLGGASKLFKFYIKNYDVTEVTSFCDLRWGSGSVYYNLGFTLINQSKPNYWYIVKDKRVHRFNYTKSKLLKEFKEAPSLTEREIAEKHNLYRIYDCGNLVFKWKK